MEEQEKKEIHDAQIEKVEDTKTKDKKNYRTEIILILIIGLLLGIMIKAEALKKLSIGFSDYKVKGGAQSYDLDAIEEKLIQEAKVQEEAAKNNQGANIQEGVGAENGQPVQE